MNPQKVVTIVRTASMAMQELIKEGYAMQVLKTAEKYFSDVTVCTPSLQSNPIITCD